MKLPTLSRTPSPTPSAAAKPRLILHAGSQKTGTTAIQYAMSENREHLRARGIWYPAIADFFPMDPRLSSARAHFAFASAVADDNRIDNKRLARLLDAAAAQPAGIDRVLLSAETLYRLTAKRAPGEDGKSKHSFHDRRMRYLERLAALTAGFDTEILLYLRRVDRYAVSFYAESIVKTDKSWSFETFLRSRDHRFDYRQTIDEFAAYFPVKLRNFEDASAAGLVQSFCDDIGLTAPLPDTPERRRPSVSNTGLLWLCRAKKKSPKKMSPTERNRRWHFALRPENADLFASDTRTSLWPDRATRDAFIARNQASVNEIAFPEPVDDPAPKPRWTKRQHRKAERRFDAWQRANAAAIRKRERDRIPPHVLDP